ncbi:hypothetical protein AAMO2058_000211000 [Amorphochlora amoebiformis]
MAPSKGPATRGRQCTWPSAVNDIGCRKDHKTACRFPWPVRLALALATAALPTTIMTESSTKFRFKKSSLHDACRNGDVAKVRELLRDPGGAGMVEKRDNLERTPLHMAAWAGHEDTVGLLIDYMQEKQSGRIAKVELGEAEGGGVGGEKEDTCHEEGGMEIAKQLAEKLKESDKSTDRLNNFLNAYAQDQTTALHFAAQAGHVNITRLLLRAGASPRLQTRSGRTALHLAAKKGVVDVASQLCKAGGVKLYRSRDKKGKQARDYVDTDSPVGRYFKFKENKWGIKGVVGLNKTSQVPSDTISKDRYVKINMSLPSEPTVRSTRVISRKDIDGYTKDILDTIAWTELATVRAEKEEGNPEANQRLVNEALDEIIRIRSLPTGLEEGQDPRKVMENSLDKLHLEYQQLNTIFSLTTNNQQVLKRIIKIQRSINIYEKAMKIAQRLPAYLRWGLERDEAKSHLDYLVDELEELRVRKESEGISPEDTKRMNSLKVSVEDEKRRWEFLCRHCDNLRLNNGTKLLETPNIKTGIGTISKSRRKHFEMTASTRAEEEAKKTERFRKFSARKGAESRLKCLQEAYALESSKPPPNDFREQMGWKMRLVQMEREIVVVRNRIQDAQKEELDMEVEEVGQEELAAADAVEASEDVDVQSKSMHHAPFLNF